MRSVEGRQAMATYFAACCLVCSAGKGQCHYENVENVHEIDTRAQTATDRRIIKSWMGGSFS
jgi:hypothetical protein